MSIRKYPAGDQSRDAVLAPRRDSGIRLGIFGTIVYTYLLALEDDSYEGKLYHPVDTPEEASTWLSYYKKKTIISNSNPHPEYKNAYFVPNTFDD